VKTLFTVTLLLALSVLAVLPANAGLVYSCDPNIDKAQAGTCAFLNSTIQGMYTGYFNDVNAQFRVQYGTTTLGDTIQPLNTVTFTNYRAALLADRNTPDDATATGATGSVGSTNLNNAPAPLPSNNMVLTNANVRALPGLALNPTNGVTAAGVGCTIVYTGAGANYGTTCFDGLIILTDVANTFWYRTLSGGPQPATQYDFFTVAEHETDEVLGLGSCEFDNSGNKPATRCGTSFRPEDLFRYNGNGTRVYASGDNADCGTAENTNACFSIDNGTTRIISYNNVCPAGICADAGDYATTCAHVQDAFNCLGKSFDVSPAFELKQLDVIGFSVPEPASFSLLAVAGGILATRFRRRWQRP
jgi:hypothetical protein